jgi:hypothetical protein
MADGDGAPLAPIPPGRPWPAALQGPSSIYLTGEDSLRVKSFSSASGVTLTITGRVLRPDAAPVPLSERHVPNSNRTVATTFHPLGEGWLLGLEVLATAGAPSFGSVWVAVDLVRGTASQAQVLQSLCFTYLTANVPASFPYAQTMTPLDGPGNFRSIQVASPAAGAEFSQTVPTNARWELVSVQAQLVTAVGGGNRLARLIIDDGANNLVVVPALSAQAASLTVGYSWGQGQGGPVIANDTAFFSGPFPNDAYLPASSRVRSSTNGIAGGDQWSAINMMVREWLDV